MSSDPPLHVALGPDLRRPSVRLLKVIPYKKRFCSLAREKERGETREREMLGVSSSVLGTVGHYLSRILVTTAAALLIYAAAKLTRKIFRAYREVTVMLSIAFGRRWMPKVKSLRIQPYLCRTEELDDVSVEECFRFHCETFQLADGTITREQALASYQSVLLSYSHTLFCRDKLDGSLRGLVLLGLEHKKTHTLLKVGLMLTHRHYRGGPWIKLAVAFLVMRELILHPTVPVYTIAKSSTYKSYLVAITMPETQPRYDKEAPEEYKQIAEDFIRSIHTPMENYNRDTFLLHRRVGLVKTHQAAISQRDMQNPHIRFFLERNPEWTEGDQLVTLARMTLWSLLVNLVKVSLKQFRQSPSSSSNVPRGNVAPGNVNRKKAAKLRAKLVRGITYQDMEAGLHSLRFHSYAPEQNEGTTTTKSCIERLYNHSDEDEDLNVNL